MVTIANNYSSAKGSPGISTRTLISLITLLLLFLFIFSIALQQQAIDNFCISKGFETSAFIIPARVCINLNADPVNYIEIKCPGECQIISEEKILEDPKDFSKYVI